MSGLGLPEVLIVLVVGALVMVPIALGVWALVDVAQRSEAQFLAAGQNRTLWVVLNAVGLVTCFLLPLVYLLAIRPKVVAGAGVHRGP